MLPHDNYIMHFNKNHDPRNGQFTKGSGGSSNGSTKTNQPKKKMNPTLKKVLLGAGITAGVAASLVVTAGRLGAVMGIGNAFINHFAERDRLNLGKATPEIKSIGNKRIRDLQFQKEKSNIDFYNTLVKLDNQSKDSKSRLKQLSKDFDDYFKLKNGYNDPMIRGNWKKK